MYCYLIMYCFVTVLFYNSSPFFIVLFCNIPKYNAPLWIVLLCNECVVMYYNVSTIINVPDRRAGLVSVLFV
jgi:hypothetical protein